MTPLVSILVPVYNRIDLIRETLAAACAQTYASFEVVVCDNCSTDGTWELLTELAATDSRLRIFRQTTNRGPVWNWLSCLEHATGELAKILWSDDLISAEFLERTVPWLRDPEVGFVYTAAHIFREPGQALMRAASYDQLDDGAHPSRLYIERALTAEDFPVSPGCALFRTTDLRRNLWRDVPNRVASDFSQHAIGNDLLVFLLTAAQYPRFAVIRDPLSQFREHDQSISIASSAGRLRLHYDIARAAFVETAELPTAWVRRFNAKLWLDLKRFDGRPYGLLQLSDFYPTREVRFSARGAAGWIVRYLWWKYGRRRRPAVVVPPHTLARESQR